MFAEAFVQLNKKTYNLPTITTDLLKISPVKQSRKPGETVFAGGILNEAEWDPD